MSNNIFALHDQGGEHLIIESGKTGWVVFAEKVGDDPQDNGGKDFSLPGGINSICRLAYGWYGEGNVPESSRFDRFSQRCANFAAASRGCKRWIVGNEMNLAAERGVLPDGSGQVLTPDLYAQCFRMVRDAIRRVQPDAEVITGAVAPWNNQTAYPGNSSGDWVDYYRDMLRFIGEGNIDGIALHTYTHGRDPNLIYSDATMGDPFGHRHYHFRCFEDFMVATPQEFRGLPVYITEFDADTDLWGENNGLIQAAYESINDWNQKNSQQILCLALYRWGNYDKWCLSDKGGSLEDFKQALVHDYKPRDIFASATKFRALTTLNARMTPGNVNKDARDVVGSVAEGEEVFFTGDRTIADGITWVRIETRSYLSCWVAEVLTDGTVTLR